MSDRCRRSCRTKPISSTFPARFRSPSNRSHQKRCKNSSVVRRCRLSSKRRVSTGLTGSALRRIELRCKRARTEHFAGTGNTKFSDWQTAPSGIDLRGVSDRVALSDRDCFVALLLAMTTVWMAPGSQGLFARVQVRPVAVMCGWPPARKDFLRACKCGQLRSCVRPVVAARHGRGP
jgi:hypothetical protein